MNSLEDTAMTTRRLFACVFACRFACPFAIGPLFAASWPAAAASAAAPDAAVLLKNSDVARGGGLPGVVWRVALRVMDGDKVVDEQGLTIKADTQNSLAEFFSPPNIADQKLLISGRNIWFLRTGLRKPVPISPRQRLLGQASNGDIAATNYAGSYLATWTGDVNIDGRPCHQLDLLANGDNLTYPRIRYWIAVESGLAVKADFFALSQKVIKSATFEYANTVEYKGKKVPFISRMTIEDQINKGQKTVLEYSHVLAQEVPRRYFDVNFLAN